MIYLYDIIQRETQTLIHILLTSLFGFIERTTKKISAFGNVSKKMISSFPLRIQRYRQKDKLISNHENIETKVLALF